jgi:hypothetical protein
MTDAELQQLRDKANESVQALQAHVVSSAGGQPWNPWLISFLTLLVIGFSVFVLHYMRSMLKEGQSPGDVLRLATMPMVIAAAVFLVLLGFSNEQMTPVIGLLGTMIGYILGSATSRVQSPSSPAATSPPSPSGKGAEPRQSGEPNTAA